MFSISSSPSMAPQPIAYTQVGQIPVGHESSQQRLQRIRPVEQAPAAARASGEVQGDSAATIGAVSDQDKRKQAKQALKEKAQYAEHEQLKRLASRDREVRAHEQAHKAVAGSYGGAIHFEYERGPDGNRYAVGGEVSIDTSPESSPEATLAKARTIQRAANAPSEPSDQDRAVAAQAAQMEQLALQQLAKAQQESVKSQEPAGIISANSSASKSDFTAADDNAALTQNSTVFKNGTKNRVKELPDYEPSALDDPGVSSVVADPLIKRMGVYRTDDAFSLNFHARA